MFHSCFWLQVSHSAINHKLLKRLEAKRALIAPRHWDPAILTETLNGLDESS